MVVVVSRKPNQAHKRLQEKLDHLHHQKGEDESDSGLEAIRAFRTQVSKGLRGLIAGPDDAQVRSLSWAEQGLKLLRGLDSAFKSLIEAGDCPMSKWGSALADEYLGYTLRLLDLFNSISASLAHLQSVRLSLAHALSSPSSAATRLLSFAHRDRHRARSWAESGRGSRGGSCHGKERSVLEALLEMKGVALWVCRAVLSGLGGEMVKKDEEADFPLLADLDSRDYGEFTEVREVNEMVSGLLGAAPLQDESKEMQRKVESFQRKLEVAVEEVNCFFSQVLASRNAFMDCFSLQNQ